MLYATYSCKNNYVFDLDVEDKETTTQITCIDQSWIMTDPNEAGNDGDLVPKCVPDCGKPCKNKGVCVEDEFQPSLHYCKCPDEWAGLTCEEKACRPACAYGECMDGACVCPAGVTGTSCDNRECNVEQIDVEKIAR